jgi:hypothetical protein
MWAEEWVQEEGVDKEPRPNSMDRMRAARHPSGQLDPSDSGPTPYQLASS